MFNLFGKRTAKDFVEEAKETYLLPEAVEEIKVPEDPKLNANANYTIGVNEHGCTQLRMQLEYGSATLTMNDAGTIDLIEDLAHALRKRFKVTIEPIEVDVPIEESTE
jgi:hypothetical protein